MISPLNITLGYNTQASFHSVTKQVISPNFRMLIIHDNVHAHYLAHNRLYNYEKLFITVGVVGFQANPAEVTNPGQAKIEWQNAGSLLQCEIMETFPCNLLRAVCPDTTLDNISDGDPEILLQAAVPVQMPMSIPLSWRPLNESVKLEFFWRKEIISFYH